MTSLITLAKVGIWNTLFHLSEAPVLKRTSSHSFTTTQEQHRKLPWLIYSPKLQVGWHGLWEGGTKGNLETFSQSSSISLVIKAACAWKCPLGVRFYFIRLEEKREKYTSVPQRTRVIWNARNGWHKIPNTYMIEVSFSFQWYFQLPSGPEVLR